MIEDRKVKSGYQYLLENRVALLKRSEVTAWRRIQEARNRSATMKAAKEYQTIRAEQINKISVVVEDERERRKNWNTRKREDERIRRDLQEQEQFNRNSCRARNMIKAREERETKLKILQEQKEKEKKDKCEMIKKRKEVFLAKKRELQGHKVQEEMKKHEKWLNDEKERNKKIAAKLKLMELEEASVLDRMRTVRDAQQEAYDELRRNVVGSTPRRGVCTMR